MRIITIINKNKIQLLKKIYVVNVRKEKKKNFTRIDVVTFFV